MPTQSIDESLVVENGVNRRNKLQETKAQYKIDLRN